MRKKDLRHLSRSELVDLVYKMDKTNTTISSPVSEQIRQERKRIRKHRTYRKALFRTVSVLAVVAALSVLVATLWMPVLKIYGSSMSPTLEPGEIIVTVKEDTLKTGDIVAFWQGNKLLIKRVIASPGQWVDMQSDGSVSVDGEILQENYLLNKSIGTCDITLPHQVAESHWFLMGDNRDTSLDSRISTIGDVSQEQIEGKILFRIWPLTKAGKVK